MISDIPRQEDETSIVEQPKEEENPNLATNQETVKFDDKMNGIEIVLSSEL